MPSQLLVYFYLIIAIERSVFVKYPLPADVESFQNNGYFLVENAFIESDLYSFKNALNEIVCYVLKKYRIDYLSYFNDTQNNFRIDSGIIALRQADPHYVSLVQRTISRTPEFYRLSSSPQIAHTIKKFLNMPLSTPLYLTNNGVIFTTPFDNKNKRASNIELDWHKDTFYTIPRSRFIHMWAPLLHDSTKEIGTLVVCRRSHKAGIDKQRISLNAAYDHRYTIDKENITDYEKLSIEIKLGQALIFDGNLIHRSGINTSKYVRCSLIGMCHDIREDAFSPLYTEYKYSGETPESYFYEVFGDPNARLLAKEQLASQE